MQENDIYAQGKTFREELAARSLQAILTYNGPYTGTNPRIVAKLAIEYADALISELAA